MAQRTGITMLVCGSRDWPERDLWWVDARMIELANDHDRVHVITGGARGVDRRADACALRCANFTREVVWPDWDRHGKGAGFERNLAMLDRNPDLVLAFHHAGSGGTAHTIREARKRGIPVEVHTKVPPPDLAALDYEDEPIPPGGWL